MSKYVVYKEQTFIYEQLVDADSFEEAQAKADSQGGDFEWELYATQDPKFSGGFLEWVSATNKQETV